MNAPAHAGLWAGGTVCALLGAVAAASLVWVPHDVSALDISVRLRAPSVVYPLGTDHLGRDMVSMLMAGARNSIAIAMGAVAIGAALGVPLGLASAAVRRDGWVNHAIMRANDLVFAFPSLVTAILMAAVFGPSAWGAILAIGIFNIPVFARLSRGAALPLWTQDYVRAAQAMGKSRTRISAEHVFPNVAGLLVVQATLQLAIAVLAEAALSYVGLGTQPPAASWGRMLADAQTLIHIAPRLAVLPGLAIVILVLGLNLLGEGLRDALDPRLGRRRAR